MKNVNHVNTNSKSTVGDEFVNYSSAQNLQKIGLHTQIIPTNQLLNVDSKEDPFTFENGS